MKLLHLVHHKVILLWFPLALLLNLIFIFSYQTQNPDYALGKIEPIQVSATPISLPKPQPVDIIDELSDLTGGSSIKEIKCEAPLVPFYDRVIRATNTTDTQRIPRILHVSFKSRCLPRDLIAHMERWKTVLPNYSIFFHDDDAVSRLIYENNWPRFPNLHKLMKCVKPGAMTIDVWRVLILYKYGGVYTDIDNWPLDSLFERNIGPDHSAVFFSDAYARPSQWFMASQDHHPIMYLAMTYIMHQIVNIEYLQQINLVATTGPAAFKIGYEQFFYDKGPIYGGGTFIGMHEMSVRKFLQVPTDRRIRGGYKFNDIVPFNATLNVTRRQRIELESGVVHWNYKEPQKTYNRTGSCKNLIAR